jgi:hypothetical protein
MARRADVVRRGLRVSMLIGTILVAINQGDVLSHDGWQPQFGWKRPLTYFVPYAVSTFASVQAINGRAERK